MFGGIASYMHSSTVEHHLKALREDYERVEGRPFEHFYCPILGVDERAPLCMGHIVNEACPDSYRGRVVQREDVDNFYGALAEAEFTTLVQARSMDPRDVLCDPILRKRMKPKLMVGGEVWPHYPDRGPGERSGDHSP